MTDQIIIQKLDEILAILKGVATPDPPVPIPLPELDPNNLPEGIMLVKVIEERVPLREIVKYNKSGRPVFGIFGKRIIARRIVAKMGKRIAVYRDLVQGDGGSHAYRIADRQTIDNHKIYGGVDTSPSHGGWLFILERHVELV